MSCNLAWVCTDALSYETWAFEHFHWWFWISLEIISTEIALKTLSRSASLLFFLLLHITNAFGQQMRWEERKEALLDIHLMHFPDLKWIFLDTSGFQENSGIVKVFFSKIVQESSNILLKLLRNSSAYHRNMFSWDNNALFGLHWIFLENRILVN